MASSHFRVDAHTSLAQANPAHVSRWMETRGIRVEVRGSLSDCLQEALRLPRYKNIPSHLSSTSRALIVRQFFQQRRKHSSTANISGEKKDNLVKAADIELVNKSHILSRDPKMFASDLLRVTVCTCLGGRGRAQNVYGRRDHSKADLGGQFSSQREHCT